MLRFLRNFVFLIMMQPVAAQNDCNCPNWNENDMPGAEAVLLSASSSPGCRAKGYTLLAGKFLAGKEADSAAHYLSEAESFYTQKGCGETYLLPVYKLRAALHFLKAEYQPALDYHLKIILLSHSSGDAAEEAESMLNISQIFARMDQPDKGLEYARKPLSLVQKMDNSPRKADLLNKIGSRYYFFFQDNNAVTLLDSAAIFFNAALALSKGINYQNGMQVSYNKMNSLAYRKKNFRQALLYIDSSIAVAGGKASTLATSYGDRANIFLKTGNFIAAKEWADSCLYYNEKDNFPPLMANVYSLLAEIADSSRDYKSAFYYLNLEKKITDSLNKVEKVKAVNEVEKKYNQAKNEKTIRELSQQKLIYTLLGMAGLLVAGLIAFYFRQLALKHKQTILETEQRLNRARMNPHFFFNALTALQRFAMKENDGKALAINLSKFSNIMRETLESTYREYVTIKQEVDFLKEYIEIQRMRFPELFSYSLMVDGEMEPGDILIPSMIIQPFIENSIEHGFMDIDYKGELRVDFKQDKQSILIVIRDNGRGLSYQGEKSNAYISRASQIIKDRIYLLNIRLKTKADFKIDNDSTGKGVVVKINLPLIYKHENSDH